MWAGYAFSVDFREERGPPAARVSHVDWTPAEAPAKAGFHREASV